MIHKTTYYSTKCDVCGKDFRHAMDDEQKQTAKLTAEKWFVSRSTNEAVCPDCVERVRRVLHLIADMFKPDTDEK